MTDAKTIIKDWCAAAGMPEPSDGECHALEVALQQQSGISGELPSAQDREDAERWKWLKTEAKGHDFDNLSIRLPEQMDAYADAARAAKGADHG